MPRPGTLVIDHEGISVKIEWPAAALPVTSFSKALDAVTAAWAAVAGKRAIDVPASALKYDAGEA